MSLFPKKVEYPFNVPIPFTDFTSVFHIFQTNSFNFPESVSSLPFYGFDIFTAQKVSHHSCPSPSLIAVNHEVITIIDPKSQVSDTQYSHNALIIIVCLHCVHARQ